MLECELPGWIEAGEEQETISRVAESSRQQLQVALTG